MQIHNLLDWRTHLPTLRAWKADKRIRYLGITHYTQSAHDELEAVMRAEKLDFVQLNYALDDRAAERRLLPLAAERGIAVLVNQPFGGGGLLRKLCRRQAAGLGGRDRLHELGAGAAEVRARQPGGDLRHPRHRQAGAHGGQLQGRFRSAARRRLAQAHHRGVGRRQVAGPFSRAGITRTDIASH